MRNADVVERFGGDECVVLLRETDHAKADFILKKLQSRLINVITGR